MTANHLSTAVGSPYSDVEEFPVGGRHSLPRNAVRASYERIEAIPEQFPENARLT